MMNYFLNHSMIWKVKWQVRETNKCCFLCYHWFHDGSWNMFVLQLLASDYVLVLFLYESRQQVDPDAF